MDMLAYTPVEYNYLETLAKNFIIPVRQKQFIKKKNKFTIAPVCRIPIAKNKIFAFIGTYTKNPFCYQQFELRYARLLRGSQPSLDFDVADNCRLYVATMEAMIFQDDIRSLFVDIFENHSVLVFKLTPLQDGTENCHYPELVGEPLRRELNFTLPLEHVTELIVLGQQMSLVVVDKLGVAGKII